MAPVKGDLLARSDFPIYLVNSLGERHFLVAGGGGSAKTGVANAIEIYEVKKTEDKILSGSVCRHDVGIQAPMNGASFYDGRNHLFAAGLDDECHLFSLKYKVVSPTKPVAANHLGIQCRHLSDCPGRRAPTGVCTVSSSTFVAAACGEKKADGTEAVRRKGGTDSTKDETTNETKHVTFEVEKLKSVQTDFCDKGSFQKVVRFSPDGSILATGGADGYLRVWRTEDLHKLYEVEAHKSGIDDLDINPSGSKTVTLSRDSDSCCCVWNTKDGKRHVDIRWPGKSEEYRFRACRFGIIEGNKDNSNLYTINIPSKRQAKPLPCCLAMWDGNTFKPKLVQSTGPEVLSSMAVSNDGVYVGVGMITGSVAVYIAFSLQKLYYVKEVHGIFVTGLDFMPVSDSAKAVTGENDFTLLSVSADNTVRVHQEPSRSSYNILALLIAFILVVFLIFWLIAELGL